MAKVAVYGMPFAAPRQGSRLAVRCEKVAVCGMYRGKVAVYGMGECRERGGFPRGTREEVAGCGIVRPSCRFFASDFERRCGIETGSLRERWPFMGIKVAGERLL
jgi:hypothetical protein